MKVEKLTYDQVAAAADSLTAEGKKVTFDAVREHVGMGSFTTIHKHLTQWRESQPAKPKRVRQVPEAVLDALTKSYEQLEAEAKSELELKLVELNAELLSLSAENAKLETENESLTDQATALTTERDRLAGKAEQQEKEISELREKVTSLEKSTESAVLEIATARVNAKTLAEREQDNRQEILRLRDELNKLQESKIKAEQEAAVLAERVTSLQNVITTEKENALAASKSASETIKKLEDRAESIAKSAAEQAQKSEDHIKALQTALDASRKSESEARETIALLRGKIEAEQLKQQKLDETNTNANALHERQE